MAFNNNLIKGKSREFFRMYYEVQTLFTGYIPIRGHIILLYYIQTTDYSVIHPLLNILIM